MPLAPLTRPLVFFDLETTGLLVELDRIIEISLIKFFPDGREEELTQRFDPGIKIPAESIAIHHITNAELDGQPTFIQFAPKLFEIFDDADLGGYAMGRLDIPMLTKEFARAGLNFSMEGRRIVDASTIFREKERRNLVTAYQFYCGKELVGAHGARADNRAAWEVLKAQIEKYPDLPRDMDGLNAFCTRIDPTNVDRDGRLLWRDGEAFFNFGKHRYHSLAQVCSEDPEYMEWLISKGDFPDEFVEICRSARRGVFPRKTASGHKK